MRLDRLKWMTSTRVATQGLILGLLSFAFGLRVYKVTSIPLSLDEILTITRYVPLAVIDIFRTHPPNRVRHVQIMVVPGKEVIPCLG